MEEKKGKRWNACWPDETDLTALKSLAHTFLYLEIQPTKMSPLVVKHPFTDSGITAIRDENNSIQPADLLNNQQALDCWRGQMAQNIQEAESSNQLVYMVTKSYRLAFLKYAAGYLSERDAASALNFVWTTSEAPNSDPNLSRRELLALFRSVSPSLLMDKEELQVYEELPDLVTVYRGVTPYNAKMVKGLSWTLDRDTRAAIPVKNGWVLPRTVSPRWILSISKMVSNIFSRITKNWKVSGQTLWWWKRWSGSINNSISQIWA